MPNLRHDPDAAVLLTEVWQLPVSEGSAASGAVEQPLEPSTVDTAFVATALGHSLWAQLWDTTLWSIAQVEI